MGEKKPFVLFFLTLVLVIIICISIMHYNVFPIVQELSATNAHYIALKITNDAVYKRIKDVTYQSLVTLEKNENGKIMAINANVMEMNKIATEISSEIQTKLEQSEESSVTLPLGSVLGSHLLSAYGPKFSLKIIPLGNVEVNFNSTFEEAGINQTRHRISIEILTTVNVIAPIYTSTESYRNEILVAETIIVGDTPSSYYHINGIQGLTTKDTLDLIEQGK